MIITLAIWLTSSVHQIQTIEGVCRQSAVVSTNTSQSTDGNLNLDVLCSFIRENLKVLGKTKRITKIHKEKTVS